MSEKIGDRAAALAALKRAVSEGKVQKRADVDGPIPRRTGEGSTPLSFAQQRLWLLDQFAPGNYAYNVPRALRLHGPLDAEAMERALDTLVRRHEVLRTPFAWEDGSVVQVVRGAAEVTLARIDLRPTAASEREGVLRRRMVDELRRPFDLSRDVMLRATLYRLADDEHVLLVVTHHIASDGWSKGVLFRELGALYTAYSRGEPSPLLPLPIQYADYALWQRRRLTGELLEGHLAYWRKHLAGAPPALELPTDRPRPANQTYRGEKQYPELPKALYEALRELARREGVTLFMVLMAAFKALLSRYTGQGDVVVGTTVAGRTRAETEGLIGFFMNTLALRTDLSDDPTFRELLRREREVLLGAYEHQEIPFEKLVEELEPTRDLSRQPLVQVIFLLDTPAKAPEIPGLAVTPVEVDTGAAKYDVILALVEEGGELRGKIEYNTDLFDAATITRFLGHYEALLGAVAREPGLRISEVSLLGEGERTTLIVDWNATESAYPREATVSALFEAQAARRPEATAIVHEGRALTYGELDRRANRLANHLRGRGVGPGALVGIATMRSIEMVVGLLGVLKAGAAYVPIDPTYPRDRVAFMLSDAGTAALLTDARAAGSLPEHDGAVIRLDDGALAAESERAPASGVTAEDRAYVIYTSGSTGKPKGVEIPHRALVNFLAAMQRRPGIGERDVLAAVTSLSFDIAGLEIFLPLVTGAKLVVIDHEVASDGARLAAALDDPEHRATMIQATPATFRLLLQAGWAGRRELTILCGGEALPADLADKLVDRCGALWNMYGPTETTIWSCVHPITSRRGPILVGRPIENTQLYIVDARIELVPIGVPGELLIGGDGVAKGYLNRPELTAEKFIPNRFQPGSKTPLYRTGDLARYRADGTVELLGRIDHQVKIRGHRIELGEIEAALARHPGVRQSVVVARDEARGDRRIVAYVVPGDPAPPAAELRRHLRASLPEIMVPSAFVTLAALPLTPNGKIDRRALPAPEIASAGDEGGFVAPEGPIEAAVAAIFGEVLGAPRVSADANFFELGGHSLLAMQVIGKVQAALGARLPMRSVFEAPTVAALAGVVAATRPADDDEATRALLAELEGMSDEEAERLLARELLEEEG